MAGASDRILKLASQRADIVTHSPISVLPPGGPSPFRFWTHEEFAERVRFFQQQAGDRLAEIEVHIPIIAVLVTDDRRAAVERFIAARGGGYEPEQLLDTPGMLVGTVDEIAAQLAGYRERYGITYFSVFLSSMPTLGPVVEKVKARSALVGD